MTLCEIRWEAGLSHVSDTTVYRALQEYGIGAYQELFKFILNKENQKKQLVSEYRRNLNNWTVYYVVGLSSLSKVKKLLFFFLSRKGERGCVFAVFFAPVPEKEILDFIAHGSIIQVSTILKRSSWSWTPKVAIPIESIRLQLDNSGILKYQLC